MTMQATPLDEAIGTLRSRVEGAVSLPGEPGYELSIPWNVAIPTNPYAVVAATSIQDVAATVQFAKEQQLRVAVKRTGHGGVPILADTILIHTGLLTECAIDPETRIARIGAGLIWQDVIDDAAPLGLAPLTGSSPTVGVAGYLTGGGIGPMVRTYGLSADYVHSFDVVTGNGKILHVTKDENADLFWGLRGGKATLGIVTAIEVELVPISEFYGGALYFDGSDAATVAHEWLDWCVDLPEHSSTSIAFLQLPPLPDVPPPLAGKLTFAVRFASLAEHSEAEALISRIRSAATPLIDAVTMMPYSAIAAVHADPVDPMPAHEYGALTNELTHEAIDALLAVAGPDSSSPQTVIEIRLLGGALAREPRHHSAFSHRDSPFTLFSVGVLAPEIAEAVVAHADTIGEAMAPWATGHVFPNFSSSADPDRIARTYDQETGRRLSALAETHDPHQVLATGQVMRRRV